MSSEITAKVWEMDLPSGTKLVLLALADYADQDYVCWPAMSRLKERCNYSKVTVDKHLKYLRDNGYLEIRPRKNGAGDNISSLYIINLQPPGVEVTMAQWEGTPTSRQYGAKIPPVKVAEPEVVEGEIVYPDEEEEKEQDNLRIHWEDEDNKPEVTPEVDPEAYADRAEPEAASIYERHQTEETRTIKLLGNEKEFAPLLDDIQHVLNMFNTRTESRYCLMKGEHLTETAKLIGKKIQQFSIDDVKVVVARQWVRWGEHASMRKFFTPQTLMKEDKFETYLFSALEPEE